MPRRADRPAQLNVHDRHSICCELLASEVMNGLTVGPGVP